MSEKEKKEIVVSKEDAVFRLDGYGRWYNKHGAFEHKKIIEYFHSSIRKDEAGYHLFQRLDDHTIEKVYFAYEDTALFVFNLEVNYDSDEIRLILNTKEKIPLNPETLFIQNENLYTAYADHRVKFIDRAILKLGNRLKFDQDGYHLVLSGKTYDIPIRS